MNSARNIVLQALANYPGGVDFLTLHHATGICSHHLEALLNNLKRQTKVRLYACRWYLETATPEEIEIDKKIVRLQNDIKNTRSKISYYRKKTDALQSQLHELQRTLAETAPGQGGAA